MTVCRDIYVEYAQIAWMGGKKRVSKTERRKTVQEGKEKRWGQKKEKKKKKRM